MAWFTFTDASEETFVARVVDPATIEHARSLIAGTTAADPRIGGTILKAPAPWNIGWSYHLDPDSVFFFEVSAEVGDSTMRYIEDHLAEVGGAFLPGSVWTPWTSELLEELAAQRGTSETDAFTGSGRADLLLGRGGDDSLLGRAGDDHLVGGSSSDRLNGGAGDDKLSGGAARDLLRGGDGYDIIVADSGNDVLYGGRGVDTLTGGRGGDRLSGGESADRFRFDTPDDVGFRHGKDTVCDFEAGLDQLDFTAMDLDTAAPGRQRLTFVGGEAFSGRSGELRFENGTVAADTDGDGGADFQIAVRGVDEITRADLLL